MKYLALICTLWIMHNTLNALSADHKPEQSYMDKRNACIDMLSRSNVWCSALCNRSKK
jgi:hypothetical protein